MAGTTQISTTRHNRFWEIDLLRTIAIVGMITFHTFDLLYYFDLYPTNMLYGPWWWWTRRVNAGIFIFLAGVALTITYSRGKRIVGVYAQRLENIRMGLGDYFAYMASRQRCICPIRHTPLFRDCIHTRTFLFKIPLH